MQSINVSLANAKIGERYKYTLVGNEGIYSGTLSRKDPNNFYFTNALHEYSDGHIVNQASHSVGINRISSIFVAVPSTTSLFPPEIARKISEYGGRKSKRRRTNRRKNKRRRTNRR